MNTKSRRQLAASKRKILRRLDKTKFPKHFGPVLTGGNLAYEIAERVHGSRGMEEEPIPTNISPAGTMPVPLLFGFISAPPSNHAYDRMFGKSIRDASRIRSIRRPSRLFSRRNRLA